MRHLLREVGKPPAEITRDDVIAFVSRYDNPSTRSTILSYLRCFFTWASDEGKIGANPAAKMPKIKVPMGAPRPAPVDDVRAVLATAPARTRMWVLLMAYCGLRCCEVALVRPEHLSRHVDGTWHLLIPRSKGGHRQSVPVPGWVADELRAAEPWAVSAQTVQLRVRKALKAVGSACTAHQLRHYYGTSLLATTGNLRKVQDMMRHRDPSSTARYTQVVSAELSEAAEALPRLTPAA